MGVYGGPKISSDGLVLSLDAANLKGYDKFENLTLQTSGIGLTSTYSVGGIVGLNTTATTDPNGGNQASLLDNNGNVNNYVYGSAAVGLTTNTTYTYSIHIKQGTKPDFQITIDENGFGGKRYFATFTYSTETVVTGITGGANDGVVVGSTTTKLTNGWYRLALSFRTSTASVSGFIDMINRFGNTSGSNYLWGRQLEKGSSVTDYYATTGTIKNRGTTWTDLSGRGNNGTLTNGPNFNSSNSGFIVFDGVDDFINIPDSSLLTSTSALTINCWVRATAFSGSYSSIIGKGTSDSNEEYCVVMHSSFLYFDVGGGSGPYTQPSYTFNTNTWYNICCTHLRTAGTSSLLCYVNGVSLNNSTTSPTSTPNDNSLPVSIGSRYYNSTNGPFNGNIAQASIYNRALTAEEIRQNYIATKSRYGL